MNRGSARAVALFGSSVFFLLSPRDSASQDSPAAPVSAYRLSAGIDADAVRRRNAETLKKLALCPRGNVIVSEPVADPPPARVKLEVPLESSTAALLPRARDLLASSEARQRRLVAEVRKDFFRDAEESSERHRVWAELLLEKDDTRKAGVNELGEAILYDPRNLVAWEKLTSELLRDGRKIVDPRRPLRADARAVSSRIEIVLDPAARGKAALAAWIAYGREKALALEEANAASVDSGPTSSCSAKIGALERLVETYAAESLVDAGERDPTIEFLAGLRRDGLLRAYVHVDVAPGPLADARAGGAAPTPESVREYLARYRVSPPMR